MQSFFLPSTACCNSNTTAEYFISATALKRCRFAMLCETREVWGNSASAACINPHPFFSSFLSFLFTNLCEQHIFFLLLLLFLWYKAIGIRLPALACASSVTKPHGDFDSLKREQDYCCSLCRCEASACTQEKGKGRERETGGMNAMHVWEVVLAGFEINDLNMCYS